MIDSNIFETIRHSVTRKMLIVVFSVYIVLTIIITAVHMSLEYKHSWATVETELLRFQEIVHDSLAEALWNFDKDQVKALLKGTTNSTFVEGAKIESDEFKSFAGNWYTGFVKSADDAIFFVDESNKWQQVEGAFSTLLEHKFPIYYESNNGDLYQMGSGTLYSTNKVVFDQVKFGFFLILFNSIIKTLALTGLFLFAGFIYISRPLSKLTKAIKSVTEGKLFDDSTKLDLKDPNLDDTEVEFMLAAFNDMIDALRTVNHDLEDAKARMDAIINSMPSVIMGVDKEGIITNWNSLAERETGVTVDAAIGRHLIDVFPGYAKCLDIANSAISNHCMEIECKIPIKIKGENKYFDMVSYPIQTSTLDCAIIRIDDVTHKMYLDDFIFQNEKMNSLGNLAAGVAHEINNPLENIVQSGQNFLRRLEPSTPSNQKVAEEVGIKMEQIQAYMQRRGLLKFIYGIKESGERASTIMQHLLQFSKKSSAKKKSCSIPHLVNNVLKLIKSDITVTNEVDLSKISINKQIENNIEDLECCESEIEQVLFNVLKNAILAVKDQNKPTITIKILKEADTIGIEIEDNGTGMPESVRKRVFEPFFTTRKVGKGSGLGLSICYTIIVENHHGSISVQSYQGMGTTVLINLPIFHRDAFGVNTDRNLSEFKKKT